MKALITFLLLGMCLIASQAVVVEESVADLLKDNAKGLEVANGLLSQIATVSQETQVGLSEQKDALKALSLVGELLAKLSFALDSSSKNLVATLLKISHEGEVYGNRTEAELQELARLQEATKEVLNVVAAKVDVYHRNALRNTGNIAQKVDDLAKLISRTVLPQVSGLKCTFNSLETSQINVEVELKSLAGVRELAESSNRKLDVLESQLKQLNNTQEQRLDILIDAVKHLRPLNQWKVETVLRELIISQKRIELDLDDCSRPPPVPHHDHHDHYDHHDESYLPTYGAEVPKPQYAQPKPKQVDLEQVWSIKEPSKEGEQSRSQRVSAYAEAPEPKETHHSSSAVSWRPSLPWETVPPRQTAPINRPQPWHPAPAYGHNPKPKPKPQPREDPYASGSHNPEPHQPKSQPAQAHKPQPNHPQSYQEQVYIPQPIHSGEAFRIWYGEGSDSQGY
ncbi:uncharacterized protein LOC108094485 [Drosophila ficusphila]|uniref:uncharacterized protein LOC108094485 n=1 Tax=Drosophila ficusphila TaxID=30025 RepID=UPI0007E67367|nr:uncharacterized protein LOC108094485 [Drosophila ficusphila]